MPYADTDFFIALVKQGDRLKSSATEILDKYGREIETSETTFVELMLLSKRYGMDPVEVTTNAMGVCKIDTQVYIRAAYYIKDGIGVFDAFHAAHAEKEIISSDSVFDGLGLARIKLEG